MKYYKKLKIYKNSTGSNYYDPQKQEAFSYKWWRYLQVINGVLVFNDYDYSVTTSQHQSALLSIIGYRTAYRVSAPRGLEGISSIYSYAKELKRENASLSKAILKPRTRRSTNEYRLKQIKRNIYKIKDLIETFNLENIDTKDQIELYNETMGKKFGGVYQAIYGEVA